MLEDILNFLRTLGLYILYKIMRLDKLEPEHEPEHEPEPRTRFRFVSNSSSMKIVDEQYIRAGFSPPWTNLYRENNFVVVTTEIKGEGFCVRLDVGEDFWIPTLAMKALDIFIEEARYRGLIS